MLRLSLRSLWDHKRRLVSTVVAIVLGVAFMSGTLIVADTIDRVFDDLFSDFNEEVDVQVQGVEIFSGSFGNAGGREVLDADLADTLRSVDGVTNVAPYVQSIGFGPVNRVLDADGDPIGSSQGPPTLLESWTEDEVLNPYTIAEGRAPADEDEVAINVAGAAEGDFAVGDQVSILTQNGTTQYELVGTFRFGTADSAAGALSVDFTLAEAQRIAGLDGQVQTFSVAGDGSVSDEELRGRITDVLPETAEALTGEEAAEQLADSVTSGFAFIQQIILVFGAIALIVGAFIIFNTFSILIAQRTRELALLRAIGASQRQVRLSVLIEAVFIGLIATVLGLLGGIGLSRLATAALDGDGDLPSTGLILSTPTIVTALVAGFGITMLASVLPARNATKVPPLAALREVAVDRSGASKVRIAIGAVLVALGLAGVVGAIATGELSYAGMGALGLLIGSIVIGPVLAGPSVRLIGAFLPKLKGTTGRLAMENAARSPKRTSATASALLIGVALVGFITVFAASTKTSIEAEVSRGFTGDLLVQGEGGFAGPAGFPPAVADAVAEVDGVANVVRLAFTGALIATSDGTELPGDTAFVTALDPEGIDDAFAVEMDEGTIADLVDGTIIVDTTLADDNDLAIGDTLTITGPTGRRLDLRISALSDDQVLLGFYAVTTSDYGQLVSERQLFQAVVTVDDGTEVATVEERIDDTLDAFPGVEVLDRDGFVGSITQQINQLLTFVYVLLALSVVVAMIGIANTLSLSIHERTRELGLLRAVGLSRRQLRSAIRWEAVLISVLGTLVGLVLGMIVSFALVRSLEDFGLTKFSVPIGSLAIVVIIAALLGVLAAVRPARRAAKLDILDAIAHD